MVLHDLSLACRYSDSLVAMKDGAIAVMGRPQETVTPTFDLDCSIVPDPAGGRPLLHPPRCMPNAPTNASRLLTATFEHSSTPTGIAD